MLTDFLRTIDKLCLQGIPLFLPVGVFMQFITLAYELIQWRDYLKGCLRHSIIWIKIANPSHYNPAEIVFVYK